MNATAPSAMAPIATATAVRLDEVTPAVATNGIITTIQLVRTARQNNAASDRRGNCDASRERPNIARCAANTIVYGNSSAGCPVARAIASHAIADVQIENSADTSWIRRLLSGVAGDSQA